MNKRWALLAGLVAIAVSPIVLFLLCPHRADCLRATARIGVWLAGGLKAGLALSTLSVLAWSVRLAWLLHVDALLVRSLPQCRLLPPKMQAALRSGGLQRMSCVVSELPIAFCVGALRPVVVVSDGLARCLRPVELEAVLLHEHDHARRREPLVRAATRAAADVLFYAPVVRWWSRRLATSSELRADRAAIQTLGPGPVAGALLTLANHERVGGAAAFAGTAQLRVAQVLGDPLPTQAPELSVLGITWIGVYTAFVITCCLVQIVLTLAR